MSTKKCKFCPDGHEDPRRQNWSAHVGPQKDGDGQPIYLQVGKTGLQHVAESDAEWLRGLIRRDKEQNYQVQDLLASALYNDAAHHKQWYLWRIAEALHIDLRGAWNEEYPEPDKGIAP